jgi:lipopolysaccharide biosynthesis glycosyltransferase
MSILTLKKPWNEMMAKLKNEFVDVADDMFFSEAREIDLIKHLQQQLEKVEKDDQIIKTSD